MEVTFYRDTEGTVRGFQVSGHSGYAESGKDILCSAVSALTLNTVNSIEAFTEDEVDALAVNEEEGFRHFRLKTVSEKSKLLLDSLVLGITEIEKSYSGYLKVCNEEE